MTILDPRELAHSLSPIQFEQLLRFRLQATFNALPDKVHTVSLFVATHGRNREITSASWSIGDFNQVQTKGEILSDIVTEHNRRLNFDASCKLNLIEGPEKNLNEVLDDSITL